MSAPVMTVAESQANPTAADQPRRMSFEEWLASESEGGLTEWVNGVDWLWADEPNLVTALSAIIGVEKITQAMREK